MNDIKLTNYGTICHFTILTDSAANWVSDNLELAGWQWLGNCSFALDWRFAESIAQGMANDGLTIS